VSLEDVYLIIYVYATWYIVVLALLADVAHLHLSKIDMTCITLTISYPKTRAHVTT
jgi:hypothetical protein